MTEHTVPNELPPCVNCNRRRMVRNVVVAGYSIVYNGCDCTLRGMFYDRMVQLMQQGLVNATAMGKIIIPVPDEELAEHTSQEPEGETDGANEQRPASQ